MLFRSDGGFLPTEAEWNYAAAGGGEMDGQREYPWGSGIDPSYANYDCTGDGSAAGQCAKSDILPVGARPNGNGKWGQADLAGSMWEWNLDWYKALPFPMIPCNNCANTKDVNASTRVTRGGSFYNLASFPRAATRSGDPPTFRGYGTGARCLRTP